MGKSKDLGTVGFHAVLAKRDPVLAERLVKEGIAEAPAEPAPSVLSLVPTPPPPEAPAVIRPAADSGPPRKTSRRGLVARAEGREAGRITVYVPPDLAIRLRRYCFERDLTMTDVAAEVLVEALEARLSTSA